LDHTVLSPISIRRNEHNVGLGNAGIYTASILAFWLLRRMRHLRETYARAFALRAFRWMDTRLYLPGATRPTTEVIYSSAYWDIIAYHRAESALVRH